MNAKASGIFALAFAAVNFGVATEVYGMDPGLYAGGFYGHVNRATSEREDLAELEAFKFVIYEFEQVTPEQNNPSLSRDESSLGFVFGFRVTPYLAFEGSYLDLGEVTFRSADIVSVDGEAFGLNSRIRTRVRGPALSVLGIVPINYEWELFGRGGVMLSSATNSVRLETDFTTIGGSFTEDTTDWLGGVGVQYTFYDIYTLRAEVQRVFEAGDEDSTGEVDTDVASLSFLVSF